MGLNIDVMVVLCYVVGLVLLYLIGWLLLVPLKVVLKFLLNGVLGGLALVALNLLGGIIGLYVAVNPLTALVAGLLGLPGVVLIMLLQSIL